MTDRLDRGRHDLEELLGVEVDVVPEGSLPDGIGNALDAMVL